MVHLRLYGEPLGGVYVKLLSPERSSRRHVLISASTGFPLKPEPETRLHVQSRAPPFVNMHAYSSMLGHLHLSSMPQAEHIHYTCTLEAALGGQLPTALPPLRGMQRAA